ncbi:MAG: hypothetical protein EBU89_04610 [Actinobacteria bacterium]|nr:hypothetical protein [Actinomycetota bacterium]
MLQRLRATSALVNARVKPDASRWHSLMGHLRKKARNFTSILASIGVATSLLIGVATPATAASTWSGQGQSTLSTINGTQPFIWWSHLYGSELLYIVKTNGNIFELRSMNSLTSTSTTIMQVPPPYVHLSYDYHTFSWVENAGTFYFVGGNSTYGVAVYKYTPGGVASLAVDVDKTSTAIAFGATSTGSLIKWRNELWFTDSNGSATSTNGLYHWDWTSSTAKLAAVTATNSGGAAGVIQTPTLFNDKIYYRIGSANVSVGSAAGVELYSFDGLKVELAANTYPETFAGSSPNSGTPIAQSANSGLLPTGSASGCNFDGNNDHFVTTSQYMAFYAKSDSSGKFELWVMDTAGNVTNLRGKDPGSLANPNPDCLVNFNDTLYYTGSYDTSVGYELYKVTGGSSPTATLVSDITPGSGSTFISSVHTTGSKMYYYVNGVGVYSFDGTTAAVKVADVPTSGAYNMQGFIPFDGKIWAATTVSSTTVFGSTPIDGATQAPVLAAQPDVTVPTGNITINPPAITTGPVSLWQISNLPAGLRYDPYTGIITGTVNTPVDLTVGTNQVSYVAINSNFYTSTPTKMKLLITNSQPSFPASQSLSTFVNVSDQFAPPINSGGAVTSWSVNPALPTGLSMSSTTGYISGTAPATASSGAYTVTVSNAAGATTYTLNFAVKAYAPAYSYNAAYTNTCNYGVTCSNPALPSPIIYFNSLTSASSASFSYAVTGLPDGLAMNSSTGAITGTSTSTGTYLLSMVVSNSSGSTTLPLKLTVGGTAPTFTVADVTAPQSSAYTSWVVPTPSSGTITTWSATGLPTGLTLNASTGAITGTPTIAGTFNVSLTGNNYGTAGNATTVNFVFTVTPVAPVVTAGQTKTCEASVSGTTACSYTFTTSAGTATSWSITPALPNGLSLNTATGVISGAALDNTQQLSTAYTVTASNAVGSGSATFMLAINDYALVFTNASPSSITVTAFTPMTPWRPITLTAGHIAGCSAFGSALPTGLVINSSTCEISGTPTSGSVTTLLAISALGRTYQTSSSITINVTNVAPTVDPIPDASQGNGLAFSYTPTGKWINSLNSFSCSISANKPTWLSINSTTCALSGTVPIINNAIGSKVMYSNITVTASNTYGSSSQTFSITALPTKPVALSAGSYTWAKDSAITTVPRPTLSYPNALNWSISPALPAGLSLDTTTGTITGTPTATMASTTYTWTATNDGGSATITATYAVTVQKPAFGTTVYSGAQSLTVDQPMTTINPPAYTNAGSPPTSWAISPALPTGLTFDTTTGSLSGTPTAAKSSTTYTVTSTNSGGTTSFTSFTIVAAGVKPTFSAVSTQNLGRGVAYSLTLPNTGSKATSCTRSSGTLPTGISLSLVNGQCVLSGTPTTITASSSVSFTASNAAGPSTALTFNIAVIDVPPVLSSVGVQSLTQGVPYTLAAPTNTGGTVTSWGISQEHQRPLVPGQQHCKRPTVVDLQPRNSLELLRLFMHHS